MQLSKTLNTNYEQLRAYLIIDFFLAVKEWMEYFENCTEFEDDITDVMGKKREREPYNETSVELAIVCPIYRQYKDQILYSFDSS